MSGAGKVFCAGADVTWMSQTIRSTEAENLRDASAMSAMFAAIDLLPVPVIGRIQGAALGGGAGLAAVCDVVVAEDGALFGFTEVKLGILPAVISPFALAKIGRSAARELFLTGARFSAARAREIGLVHAVVPAAGLDYRGRALRAGVPHERPWGDRRGEGAHPIVSDARSRKRCRSPPPRSPRGGSRQKDRKDCGRSSKRRPAWSGRARHKGHKGHKG
jgi:enoyl-CoA hydratase/carnithine racemase